jgi:F0F1-type ATP synthase assembly protein I
MRRVVFSVSLMFQLSGMIACSILGSLFLGLWLDRRLGTTPCMLLVLMVIGLVVAVVGTYRLATSHRSEQ